MDITWDVDDSTVVKARLGAFGKQVITVNGAEVVNQRRMSHKGLLPFTLPDGRAAVLSVAPQFVGSPIVELRVDDRLLVDTPKDPVKCPSCAATVKPNDRFCDGCGHALPGPEQRVQQRRVAEATGTMRALAVLFSIFGVAMYFVSKAQADKALAQLAALDATQTLDIEGVSYTVADLRAQVQWEPWGVLVTNLVLAAVMGLLALWGKRSPLPAVLAATATYVTVIVVNAIVDPKTIAQGILMKILVIAFFVKGIKAALALRAADAR